LNCSSLSEAAASSEPRQAWALACSERANRRWCFVRRHATGRGEPGKDSSQGFGWLRTSDQWAKRETAILDAKSVVGFDVAIGDEYARDLALQFYHRLFADESPKTAAVALSMSRNRLRRAGLADHSLAYDACDHATPVLHGAADPGLLILPGRSAQLVHREPHPTLRFGELRIQQHPWFVGRTWELAGLGAQWIDDTGQEARPVALIQGIGGMGKTALAAEAIDLWHRGFDWVFTYQAKPEALRLDEVLHDLHTRLLEQRGIYAARIAKYPAEAIWREADGKEFRGEKRFATLRENLLRALREEAILLVLDNFEANLRPTPSRLSGDAVYSCQDPEWDRLLEALAHGLGGTRSRLLLTCRCPLAALGDAVHIVQLGPLPTGEAALFIRCHRALRELFFARRPERALVQRVLNASRGHPLLLDRLGRLAEGGSENRAVLEEALGALEKRKDYARLPDLFAARSTGRPLEAERAYLHDALESSIDLLLDHAGAEARHLLWILSLANEPVTFGLLRTVWQGKRENQEQLAHLPSVLAVIPAGVELEPLLAQLTLVGLVTEEREEGHAADRSYICHELVRERTTMWMQQHPNERRGRTDASIWIGFGERLASDYKELSAKNQTAALEAGHRGLVYLVRAGAFDQLGAFASRLVSSTRDPRLLTSMLPHLEIAASAAPAGNARWPCRTYLADALKNAGRPDASLSVYREAAQEAEAAQYRSDLAVITGSWALALGDTGDLEASRNKQLESAEWARKAGLEINAVASELEAYRIDIIQGRPEEVLPEVEARLARIEAWFQRAQDGETVREAPDREFLRRCYISALDIAKEAHFAMEQWDKALTRIDRMIELKRGARLPEHEIARSRMNRANVLRRLKRLEEAETELEDILPIFEGDHLMKAKVLSSFASVFDAKGDSRQAAEQERRALAIYNQQQDPADRATSHANLAVYLDRYAKFNGNFVLVALRGSCGLEADGTKELLEIVDDFLIQAVQLGALLRIEFGVGPVRLKQRGSERAVDAFEEFEKEQTN